MTMSNKILLFGRVVHASKEWQQLSKIAELIECTSQSREEFISDLKTKYAGITGIFCTFVGSKVGNFDEELAQHFPASLKYIANNGAGYDKIDVHAMGARGIQVSHTPGAVDEATADTNIFLILGAIRNFGRGIQELYKGNWVNTTPEANDPQNKVLGILGMGGIGRSVRDKAKVFGFKKIVYYNRTRLSPELEGDAEYVSFDELLAQSDILSLNLPLNKHTRHILNKEALAKCKDGVVVVNTARGAVIDEPALVEALESGKVARAGLDVFENEPTIHPGLLKNSNVILLPHMGTHTIETRKLMEVTTINNLRAGIETGKVINLVPELKGKF
ncbi:glyoxylate reductase 1 [Trichomonascus vanleenenianus]|uniref:glyoxylate reductase n=1 Tax=Trichomonascus vanleenenianus TaxID=2268995 RepID=UPI003ECA22A7